MYNRKILISFLPQNIFIFRLWGYFISHNGNAQISNFKLLKIQVQSVCMEMVVDVLQVF